MVCISCIVIPLMLYIWHKFLQPIALKIWNPWANVEDKSQTAVVDAVVDDQTAASASKSSCPLSSETTKEKGKVD